MDIRWQEIESALTLALVFEGLLLFAISHRIKKTYLFLLTLTDSKLRVVGLLLVVLGLFLLMVVRS